MLPAPCKVFVSKPFYLIVLLSLLTFFNFLVKSVQFQRFKNKMLLEYLTNGNFSRTVSQTPSVQDIARNRHLLPSSASTEMSLFIENLPVKKDVDCDKFQNTATFPHNYKYFFKKTQNVSEVFDYTNCSNLRNQGFNLPVTTKEYNHPIAFSIIVYMDTTQVTRLIRAVYRPHNVYCIHIDKKATEEFFTNITNLSSCLENVFVLPERVNVQWSKFTVLEPELLCMQSLLRHKVKWKSWINLTGQEFPLKTNLELVSVLDVLNGVNVVSVDRCTHGGSHNTSSFYCTSLTKNGWKERWPSRAGSPPYGIIPYKGSVHTMLSRDFVDYLMTSEPAKAFIKWLKKGMRVPDEFLFSTINHNLHLHPPGSKNNATVSKFNIARLKLWGRRQYKPCLKVVRHICVLSLQELPMLTSSYKMFANKFYQDFSPLGYSCLEKWYFNRVHREMVEGKSDLDLDFYRHIYE